MQNRSAWIIGGPILLASIIIVAGIWFFGYRSDAACDRFRDAVQESVGRLSDVETRAIELGIYRRRRFLTDDGYVEKPAGCSSLARGATPLPYAAAKLPKPGTRTGLPHTTPQ
jgi:hypothetical protein